MNGAHRAGWAYVVATVLFLACSGVMLLLAHSRPAKVAQQQTPSGRENLDAPREVQGVPCSGYVKLAPDGHLTSCILSREHAVGSLLLPARSWILLHRDGGGVVKLPSDTRLDGHLCRSKAYGDFSAGFFPSGRLHWFYLVADETIDGVPCRHASFWGEITGGVDVRLHDNGRLEACRLAADVRIAGKTFAKGMRITLDPDGNPAPATARAR